MKAHFISALLLVAGCGGPQPAADPEIVDPVTTVEQTPTPEEPAPEEPELTTCVWSSTLMLEGSQYVYPSTHEPCDEILVQISTAEQIDAGIATFTDATTRLGSEHVVLEIGKPIPVYSSRDEVLADPAAGQAAAKVIPKNFDFENRSLARYDVLHSRTVSCRDGMLGLTGEQAKAQQRAAEEWRKQAQKLAGKWRFVASATTTVQEVEVLHPVLPDERTYPPGGMCSESWMVQPALTDVPRGAEVRLLTR